MRKILLTLVAALCCVALHAETLVFDCGVNGDNMWAEFNTGSGALFLVGTGRMVDYAKADDVPWYKYKDQITSIQIDSRSKFTSIGNEAFPNCPNLESITLPETVDSIGYDAFDRCHKLSKVNFPAALKYIESYAFSSSKLSSIKLPEGLLSIGSAAFYACDELFSVFIPYTVTKIGVDAFSSCDNLTAINVDIKNTTYCSIGGVLFSKDQQTLYAVPAGFQEPSYTVPSSVKTIGEGAFLGCKNFTEIILPQSVTEIKSSAFASCNITSMELPEGLKHIGFGAFYRCTKMESVTIPSTVTYIARACFQNCTALTSVTCKATTPPTCESLVFDEVDLTQCHLYVPESAIETYKLSGTWQEFGDNIHAIGEGIEEIRTNPAVNGRKVIYNGQVYILQEGKSYTLTGTEIK